MHSEGDEGFAHALRSCLEAVDRGPATLAIHDFHSYPARMHPAIARQAVAQFVSRSDRSRGTRPVLLDPFCGGGTTIVEAMRAGWRTLGSDLNPLAIELSRIKGTRAGPAVLDRVATRVTEIAEASEARVRGRVDVRAKISPEARAWYDVHILKELAGLLEEIDATANDDDRRALRMVFSAMAVKFSQQRSDTQRERVQKRLRKGLVTEFFVRKAGELLSGWSELADACVEKTLRPKLVRADVRKLGHTLSGDFRADLVLTSPPYGGTYDYADHHTLRLEWLGMKATNFRRDELGSRRELSKGEGAAQRWDAQVAEMLAALAPRLSDDGVAVLWVGDAHVGGRRIDANAQLRALAPESGLRWLASASQSRPDYAGGPTREEHLVALERA